jgi:hypothetical protein
VTPSRLRLLGLLALAVPIVIVAVATGQSTAFGALATAAAAATLALLLAGTVFRVILGLLLALLGVCVVVVAVLLPDLSVTALAGGILLAVVATGVVVTSRGWPSTASRYTRARVDGDPASDWDTLSAGDDPTDASR